MDPDKVKIIVNWQVLTCVADAQAFIGYWFWQLLPAIYQGFLKNYCSLSEPDWEGCPIYVDHNL